MSKPLYCPSSNPLLHIPSKPPFHPSDPPRNIEFLSATDVYVLYFFLCTMNKQRENSEPIVIPVSIVYPFSEWNFTLIIFLGLIFSVELIFELIERVIIASDQSRSVFTLMISYCQYRNLEKWKILNFCLNPSMHNLNHPYQIDKFMDK